ncbi:hypothetical protein [Sphingomonas nostoxanthinifaciens]|uniref:hypothetical protein n=1 Tax=Sphingomonas nostoxanthinifaciens TaxID=2872652 RepID=UPI001CC1DF65|nr:hypothetical protein [Sphingomonas nostoxanthinifaciens]UAK25051.1 hypothetical protein K8P63_02225 [Sphingomonas nostoxanthinifaciens]
MDEGSSGKAATAFPYHRSISPALGVLLGLALVETAVLHLIAMALWGWPIALPLGLLDVALVAVLVGLLRSIRARPVTIADGVLTMRLGWLKVVPIPLAHVAGLRGAWDAAAMKAPGVMNLALAAWPNVVVDVAPPVRVRRREIVAVAHKLDDPAVFVAALDRARAAQAPAT